jgi:hypothetical protein
MYDKKRNPYKKENVAAGKHNIYPGFQICHVFQTDHKCEKKIVWKKKITNRLITLLLLSEYFYSAYIANQKLYMLDNSLLSNCNIFLHYFGWRLAT